MSLGVSTIPAFTAALKAGLEARPNLKTVSVCDGPAPTGDLVRDELIELLDVDGEQVVKLLDRTTQPRHEQMELRVLITVVWKTVEKQTNVNERCFAILDELNQLLRGSAASLAPYYTGAAPIYGAKIGGAFTHTKRTDANGTTREAAIDCHVQWEAKI